MCYLVPAPFIWNKIMNLIYLSVIKITLSVTKCAGMLSHLISIQEVYFRYAMNMHLTNQISVINWNTPGLSNEQYKSHGKAQLPRFYWVTVTRRILLIVTVTDFTDSHCNRFYWHEHEFHGTRLLQNDQMGIFTVLCQQAGLKLKQKKTRQKK